MRCEGCFFWQAGVVGGDTDKGMCHRYPNWFVTPRDYWCGEFETKERVMPDPPRLVEIGGVNVEGLPTDEGPAGGVFDVQDYKAKWTTIERPATEANPPLNTTDPPKRPRGRPRKQR